MVFISPGVGSGSGLSDSGYLGGSGLGGVFVSVAVTTVEAPVLVGSCLGVGCGFGGIGGSSPAVTPPTLIPTFAFTPSPLNQKSESTLGCLL